MFGRQDSDAVMVSVLVSERSSGFGVSFMYGFKKGQVMYRYGMDHCEYNTFNTCVYCGMCGTMYLRGTIR